MTSPTHVTQREAELLCGKDYDTIRRYRRNGKLPNSRTRPDGTVEVAIADLVACGLLDPMAATTDLGSVVATTRAERDLTQIRQDLVVAQERNAQLEVRLAEHRDEIAFLRQALSASRAVA